MVSEVQSWAVCSCYYQRCLAVPSLGCEVDFVDHEQFRRKYRELLEGREEEYVVREVVGEVQMRRERWSRSEEIRRKVKVEYTPLYRELFDSSKFFELIKKKPVRIKDDIFTLPLFSPEMCDKILEELQRFSKCGIPSSPPTPPHHHGVFLYELGMDSLVERLRARAEEVARRVLPHLVGPSGLDSCWPFTLHYNVEDGAGDQERTTHRDNSEVSLNLCLTEDHEGGELFFFGPDGDLTLQHRRGWAVLHPGSSLHGALPITGGSRTNLLLFLRSSSVRNGMCPVCHGAPSLERVVGGTGDGFTMPIV